MLCPICHATPLAPSSQSTCPPPLSPSTYSGNQDTSEAPTAPSVCLLPHCPAVGSGGCQSPLLLEVRLGERDGGVLLEYGMTVVPGVTVIELRLGQGEPPNPTSSREAPVAGNADALKQRLRSKRALGSRHAQTCGDAQSGFTKTVEKPTCIEIRHDYPIAKNRGLAFR
jgi:hypothetical protein